MTLPLFSFLLWPWRVGGDDGEDNENIWEGGRMSKKRLAIDYITFPESPLKGRVKWAYNKIPPDNQ